MTKNFNFLGYRDMRLTGKSWQLNKSLIWNHIVLGCEDKNKEMLEQAMEDLTRLIETEKRKSSKEGVKSVNNKNIPEGCYEIPLGTVDYIFQSPAKHTPTVVFKKSKSSPSELSNKHII